MPIDYNHAQNRHTLSGPRAVLPLLLQRTHPTSLLDVGCGIGTWMNAAMELGVADVLGLEGIVIPPQQLLVHKDLLITQDLTKVWDLGRSFDLILCLEVGEHLERQYARQLVRNLTTHSETIAFSAASPGQGGQHHVNCQWPEYWQKLFNAYGFVCDDSIWWELWNELSAEPWYRQNMFLASRNLAEAGLEPRLRPVIHPEFLLGPNYQEATHGRLTSVDSIEEGNMPVGWYIKGSFLGLVRKFAKRLKFRSRFRHQKLSGDCASATPGRSFPSQS